MIRIEPFDKLSKSLGVFAVEVLAADEQAAAFYGKYGFTPLLDNARHMYLPIRTIEAAVSLSQPQRGTD